MKLNLCRFLKRSSYYLGVIALGTVLGLSLQFAKAWTEPSNPAPAGNVQAPVNIGPDLQVKSGTLTAGTLISPNICVGSSCRTTWPRSSQWTTSGSNIYYSGGHVGIGTNDTSTYTLNVGGTARIAPNSNGRYTFNSSSTSGYTTNFNMNNTGLYIGHDSSSRSLNLRTNDTDRLTILGNNGYVGIGTTSPNYRLDVEGNTRVSGDMEVTGKINDGFQCERRTCTASGVGHDTCEAVCSNGFTLTGGGIDTTGDQEIYWFESYPTPGKNSWTCGYDDFPSTCYAVCCRI